MEFIRTLRDLTPAQRNTVIASYLGWTLDSFDFFVLVFVLKDVASEFKVDIATVSIALGLTLAFRPVGAYFFGQLADKYGRRRILIIDVLLFSFLEVASGFAPGITSFLILRGLFGIAMGGEWGIGAALTMESIPAKARGVVSGILQSGYPMGYLLASVVFGVLFEHIGWRGMFIVGGLPALLTLFIRRNVPESPTWQAQGPAKITMLTALRIHWRKFGYAVLMMAVFSFGTHGTQDLYPTMLREERGMSPGFVGLIAVIYNVGGLCGAMFWGTYSERVGRRRAIMTAMVLAFFIIPFWAFATNIAIMATAAFLIQFMVQGSAGVLPVYLNEISPPEVRATFPGFSYQVGTLFSSGNANMQVALAMMLGGSYSASLAIVAGLVTVLLTIVLLFGKETKGTSFDTPNEGIVH